MSTSEKTSRKNIYYFIQYLLFASLTATLYAYSSWLLYFDQIVDPYFSLLYVIQSAFVLSLVFSASSFFYLSHIKKENNLSLSYRIMLQILFLSSSFLLFLGLDFCIHKSMPEIGQNLQFKLENYYLIKGKDTVVKNLPIGFQGVYVELFFLPIGFLITMLVRSIYGFIKQRI